MGTKREKLLQAEPAEDRLEAILGRALTAYHRDELHGGASWLAERILDRALVPVTRAAFLDADDLPPDADVLHALTSEPMALLGEGYHVVALVDPAHRFVVKYAKQPGPVPPLAPPSEGSDGREWAHDYGVRPDGSLHPAVWQHIRSFEAYGQLVVPSRVYVADSIVQGLSPRECQTLERFRATGIVRSLGAAPIVLHVGYPEGFPQQKQAPSGITASVLVVQPVVMPLAAAIERALLAGDVAAARAWEARYDDFTAQLWRCGISHLDFSILNIGIAGAGRNERLQIFDPHIGVIEMEGAPEVQDPLSVRSARSIDNVLRSSRDGSRWALWRVQQDVEAANDAPRESADAVAEVVRDFHAASEGVEHGQGSFGRERFGRMWQQRPAHTINTVLHTQVWTLVRHPLGALVHAMLDPTAPDTVYDRSIAVLGMHDDGPLTQFRAALKVYQGRPLLLVANVSGDGPRLVKHWGRLRLPSELDIQDDPAIHYHLRDLFTGEVYVCPGDDLAMRGLVVGLAPHELHVLQIEDISVEDMALERTLAVQHDISAFLRDCTKRVGVVGDVHGELQALKEILRALGFIDAFDHWYARDGTLVFTGDVGHGRHLQEVFDYVHQLAAEAHRLGGRIVWTLGNHDLYLDREGGQGGEDSLGYRLWPRIRDAVLHPGRHPGLIVQAAYFDHGKLFVHGGILPNIVALAEGERGSHDAETIASYVNDVFRRTLVEHERITARDLPHEIFHVGTSHARERRFPGEIGYEPAGVFTPDLREVDHYRYHDSMLPQVIGHTASRRGEIRYSPGSWLRRDYIAIDVGRQHGTGNGGLLLTDFGWAAVTPGEPARLIEVGPLFVRLAHQTMPESEVEEHEADGVRRMLSSYFQVTKPERRSFGEVQEALFEDLSPAQVVPLERFLATILQTGRCLVITDLDEMLTAFSGGALEEDTLEVLADYLAAGGTLVFSTDTTFEWFYARLLRPLIVELGPRSRLLANVLLILGGGKRIFAFEDGAYRLVSRGARDRASGFDALVDLSRARQLSGVPEIDPREAVYVGDSFTPGGIDHAMAARVGLVINVGDAMLETHDKPIVDLRRGYVRTMELMATAIAALNESGRAALPPRSAEVGETVLWTFERPQFPPGRRLRVRVRGSGFVHAGAAAPDGRWDPVYNVPLVPREAGDYEAVLPPGVNAFTFFWTEAPWTPGRPGHWERRARGSRVFRAATESKP